MEYKLPEEKLLPEHFPKDEVPEAEYGITPTRNKIKKIIKWGLPFAIWIILGIWLGETGFFIFFSIFTGLLILFLLIVRIFYKIRHF
jgi:hypothetical protein